MVPTIPQLRSLIAVNEHGTTTGAARAENCAPSTISTHTKRLERFLRAPLFTRANGTFTATDVGREVVRHAQAILRAYDSIKALRDPDRTKQPN
ncbi:hypothetical protein GCM10028784_32020 [Myceligenerans cantabricum]